MRSPRPRPGNLHSDCVWRVIERNDEGAPWISGLVATPPFPAQLFHCNFSRPFPTSERKGEIDFTIIFIFRWVFHRLSLDRRAVISKDHRPPSRERRNFHFQGYWILIYIYWFSIFYQIPNIIVIMRNLNFEFFISRILNIFRWFNFEMNILLADV